MSLIPPSGSVLPTLNLHDKFLYHFLDIFVFSRPDLEMELAFHIFSVSKGLQDDLKIDTYSSCIQCFFYFFIERYLSDTMLAASYSINIY